MRKAKLFGIFFLVGVLLVACGAKEEVFHEEDAGRQVELAVGEKMLVTLASNPTTGYQWDLAEMDESVLAQSGTEYDSDSPQLIGSGGEETFTFEAVGVGETALQLIYHRPWEEDVPPVETFTVTVVVK